MNRWLRLALLIIVLVIAGFTAHGWLEPFLAFLGANAATIQTLADLTQLVLWLVAGVVLVVGWWKRPKEPPVAIGPGGIRTYDHSVVADHRGVAAVQEGVAIGDDLEGDLNIDRRQAVAPGGVAVAGDLTEYHFGSIASLTIQSAVFQAPSPGSEVDPKQMLWTYLNQVVHDTGSLKLSGVDRKTLSDPESARLELAAVYTALDTVRGGEAEAEKGRRLRTPLGEGIGRERQSALAFANEQSYAALLGDPGSGKTTFANYLALCLAGHALGMESANLGKLGEEWQHGALLPVCVILRDFAAQLPASAAPGDLLWTYIVRKLGAGLSGFAPYLNRYLLEEGGLLVLDGLDEVPEAQKRREQVKQAVIAFRRHYPRVRILITSRTYAYQRQQWRLPGFTEAVLAPFSPEQIEAFVDRWYAHMAQVRPNLTPESAQGRATLLKQAIQRNEHLRELAPRPLLLTLMASLHAWRGGSLPEQREELYEQSVELLLDIWERPKTVLDAEGRPILQTESAAEWFNAPQQRIREELEALAFDVHRSQQGTVGTADIQEAQLVAALLRAADNPDIRPARVVQYISDRAGLLTHRGEGIYSFPHRTFQEYLAARHLTRANFPKQLVQLTREDPERWREVLLLAGAKVARGTPFAAWSLIARLCPQACDAAQAASASDGDWWAALLAGRLLIETDVHGQADPDEEEQTTLHQVVSWLVRLVENGRLPAVDRASAGVALARLSDPRPGIGLDPTTGLPDIAWCFVPAGPFLMGSTKDPSESYLGKETPQHRLDLPAFWMSQYPITHAQYQAFVQAGGYRNGDYWTVASKLGYWRDGKVRSYTWNLQTSNADEGWNDGPADYGAPYTLPNHPVVGVNWFEALAYSEWLTEALTARRLLPAGWRVRLPSEAEWEKAGRGGAEVPTTPLVRSRIDANAAPSLRPNPNAARTYPWGDDPDPDRANDADSGVGATSAAGCFVAGASPYGCHDLSGNVWEWTRSLWGDDWQKSSYNYPYHPNDGREKLEAAVSVARVLRGGSFAAAVVAVRCAARYGDHPNPRDDYRGFRVLAAPSTSDL